MSVRNLDRAISLAIARVIDPEAFASKDPALEDRRRVALGKAKRIERMEFDLDEISAELLATIAQLEGEGPQA